MFLFNIDFWTNKSKWHKWRIAICCLNLELIYLNLNIAGNHVIKLMLDYILTFGSVYFNSIKIDIFNVMFVFVFKEILTNA